MEEIASFSMDLRIFTEPQQGASHADLLAAAKATRSAGFSAFFRSDHVLAMGTTGLPGPSDTMVSLAALAAQVPDIKFGSLVNSATFRHPSMLAIAAATIDDISEGRLELGLGAGWFAEEHRAYGIPFGDSFGERFDRLTEQLEIITGLWATPVGAEFDYHGSHFTLNGAPGLPKPVQRNSSGTPAIPLILGGSGPRRTPALAARFAADFNVGFRERDFILAQHDRVRRACEEIGRDPGDLVYSVSMAVCCAADDAGLAERARRMDRDLGKLRRDGLAGTPDEILTKLEDYQSAGVRRFYLQVLDPTDLDHIAYLGEHVRAAIAD